MQLCEECGGRACFPVAQRGTCSSVPGAGPISTLATTNCLAVGTRAERGCLGSGRKRPGVDYSAAKAGTYGWRRLTIFPSQALYRTLPARPVMKTLYPPGPRD